MHALTDQLQPESGQPILNNAVAAACHESQSVASNAEQVVPV